MTTKTRLHTAAKMLEALIQKHLDGDPGTCEIEVLECDDHCLVSWESGPFEWAPSLIGGSSIYAGEFGYYSEINPWEAEMKAIEERYNVEFQCQNEFQVYVGEV